MQAFKVSISTDKINKSYINPDHIKEEKEINTAPYKKTYKHVFKSKVDFLTLGGDIKCSSSVLKIHRHG